MRIGRLAGGHGAGYAARWLRWSASAMRAAG